MVEKIFTRLFRLHIRGVLRARTPAQPPSKPIVISQREHQGAWIWPGHKISRKFNDELRKLGYEQRETGFWNNRPSMVVVPERIAVVVPERIAVVVPERIAVL
jgi:hypothetical protein